MFLVVEKMGAAAVDEDDEVVVVFWRLTGGAVVVPVVVSVPQPLKGYFQIQGVEVLKVRGP